MSKPTYAKLKLSQKDYELLISALGLATGYALKWDVYAVSASDPNAVNINTKYLDLMNRIMEAKDTYHEHQGHHDDKDKDKTEKKANDRNNRKLNGADADMDRPRDRRKSRPESSKEAQ